MTIPQAFQMALQNHQAGRLADAEALYRQILQAQPKHAEALQLLGVIAHQTGRHDFAVELIRRAIVLTPDNPDAHSNLGQVFSAIGRLDEAIAAYRQALEFKPDFPEIHNNLGVALAARGRRDEAISSYRRALQGRPDFVEAHNNLGNALREGGQLDEAIASYRRALQFKPDVADIHNHLANALRERGEPAEAVAACLRALELTPDHPQAHNNLGAALADLGQFDEAIAMHRRAIELQADFPEARNNLAVALAAQGQLDEAVATFRRAIQLTPEDASVHGNLIFTLHFHPAADPGTIAEERRRWNRKFGDPLKPSILPRANNRDPERRLRIGYVSPDFRDHVVGRNLIPLFECHDRESFEIVCYSGVVRPDALTDKFRRHAGQWRSTVGVGDEALANVIRRDGVDILVDLTQHSGNNRLPVFARQPAPVQVSFAGYPESTGLEAIDYRISDRFLEGESTDEDIERKEQVLFIDSFWCYDPCGIELEINELPASQNGTVAFGCLNNLCKVNERTLGLWARVLGRVKDSRLVMRSPGGSHQQRAMEALERNGVDGRRVEFVPSRPRRDYLAQYHQLDIVLDTAPYNGHTTSLDALWMGVPVVSLAGKTPVSRAGLSQLTNLRLPELVAHSEAEFVDIASDLAGDLPRLAQLRSTLRDRMKNSILMDAPRFARNVEAAYRAMWQKWREQSEDPAHREGNP